MIFVKADCFFAAYTECIWIGCVSILGRESGESIVFYDKRSSYLGVLNNSTNAGALIAQVSAVFFVFECDTLSRIEQKLEENPQKLEDALKVMEILSSVEGTTAVYDESKLKSSLLPFKDWNADDTYYGDIADEINAGNTVPLIYAGGGNTLVNTGNRMLEYIQDQATLEDVVDQLDTDQDSVVNNKPEVITTTTEIISQESCAKLIGKSFMEATKSDAALISLGEWIQGNGKDQNKEGVNGKLYAQNITEADICTILPTSWYDTIQTAELTGKNIKKL